MAIVHNFVVVMCPTFSMVIINYDTLDIVNNTVE